MGNLLCIMWPCDMFIYFDSKEYWINLCNFLTPRCVPSLHHIFYSFWVEIRAQWMHLLMYHNFCLFIVRSAFLWRLLCWSTKVEFGRCRAGICGRWSRYFRQSMGELLLTAFWNVLLYRLLAHGAIVNEIAYDLIVRWKCKLCPGL